MAESKLPLKKEAYCINLAGKFCIFLLCDWIWKKIFWYFQIWNIFLYWFINLARYLSNNEGDIIIFLIPDKYGQGRSEKNVIPPSSWFNPRIPLLELSSIIVLLFGTASMCSALLFGTASMCSALIYENHPNFEKNIHCQTLLIFVCFCVTMTYKEKMFTIKLEDVRKVP